MMLVCDRGVRRATVRGGRLLARLHLSRLVPSILALSIVTSCGDSSTGVRGTFVLSGNVSNSAGLAVADVLIEARLLYPTCGSTALAHNGTTRTSATGEYTFRFAEMFDGCVRLIATPPGGTPVVVERAKVDVRPNRDYLIVNVVVP